MSMAPVNTIDPLSARFSQVPVEVTVSVGTAHPMIRDLLRLRAEDVLSLDRRIDDPVELRIGDRLIARGELFDSNGSGQLCVRLTEIVSAGPAE